MSKQPSDAAARQLALDANQSFIVQAPAGSGKTELLTLRILSLLSICKKPEEILAITFTRKAAAEMRHRVMDALTLGNSPHIPTETHDQLRWQLARKALENDRQQNWNLLQNPNSLHIQTIDGFCRYLAGKQPVISQLGPLPETINNTVLSKEIMHKTVQALMRCLDQDIDTSTALRKLLGHLDNSVENLAALLVQLLEKREQWLFYLNQLDDENAIQLSNKLLIESLLEPLQASLKPYANDIHRFFNYAMENIADDSENKCDLLFKFPTTQAKDAQNWKNILKFLTTKDGGIRSPRGLNKNIGILPTSPLKLEIQALFEALNQTSGLEEILLQAKLIPAYPVSKEKLSFFKCLKTVLRDCAARLNIAFKQEGIIDYTGIALAALNALGNEDTPTDLSLKLDYQIKHILVDEFQDTSHLQLRLLQRLTEGWQAQDGRSLFLVGDPMQSCYQFRNADVRIFLQVKETGIGSLPISSLVLTENFRSNQNIVEWNNQTFRVAFPNKAHKNYCAIPYSPSSAFKEQEFGQHVFCYQLTGNDSSEYNQRTEALAVIKLIKQIRAKSQTESIAILVRSRGHTTALFPVMKTAGIPWHSVEMNSLNSNMLILDLMSLTRALLYPGDKLAWLALLRSPGIGLTLSDLHTLANLGDQNDVIKPLITSLASTELIQQLSPEGQKILQRCIPVLRQAWEQRQRKPLRQWIEGLWISLGGPAAANPEQLNACEVYFDLLEQYDSNGMIINWPLFKQAIEKLFDQVPSPAENSVQVMTMHKSKGLEFDHVIIIGLASQPKNGDKELLLWNEYFLDRDNYLLLLAALEETGTESDPHYNFLMYLQQQRLKHEAVRLLYVACTRAKKNLYLFASLKADDEGAPKQPDSRSLLSAIWSPFKNQAIPITENSVRQTAFTSSIRHIRRLKPQWSLPLLPQGELLSPWYGNELNLEINLPDLTNEENLIARLTGIALHKCLQDAAETNINLDQVIKDNKLNLIVAYLKNSGLSRQHANTLSVQLKQTLKTVSNSALGQWILNPNHQESACELELISNNKKFIIDRTFIDNGVRWIIDYKSSTPNKDQSTDAFLAQEKQKYYKQLQQYKKLMQQFDNGAHPIKTALYFPLLNHLTEIPMEIIP